jgi:hypothetical protein
MLCKGLEKRYSNNFGCQGIDPKGYTANIADNTLPKGTADQSIAAGVAEFTRAAQKCPETALMFTGYRLVSLPSYLCKS